MSAARRLAVEIEQGQFERFSMITDPLLRANALERRRVTRTSAQVPLRLVSSGVSDCGRERETN